LRLGFEGIQLLTERRLTLPVAEPNLSILLDVRTGKYTLKETLLLIEDVEKRLKKLIDGCDWKIDPLKIDNFLINCHLEHWRM
jgi:hypothetical protein